MHAHYSVFTKNKILFNQGKEFVTKYVSRNVSWEVQKAIAIQTMTTAMTELGMGVVKAANFADTLTGFSGQVVRRWASAFFVTLTEYPGSLDDVDDSFIEMELMSERGKACGNPTAIIHDEEFCLAAREHIRSNAYRKGEPNLTADMFRAWVSETYQVDVCVDTARMWLHHLGFDQCDHQKGVYFDGHEREDVVAYRQDFLDQLTSLDETTITPTHPMPAIADGEKRYLRVTHDESTFYANADQTRFWNDRQSQVLRQKSLGSSIMVSDFIVEGHGYLKDDEEAACLYLETQKEGYFNDMFIAQVKHAITIFERKFPDITGIFLFDNAPSHKKFDDNALNASNMNVYPGEKQPALRDGLWEGSVQNMTLPDGTPKGMKMVLLERGVNVKGMNAAKMREKLNTYSDFSTQKKHT